MGRKIQCLLIDDDPEDQEIFMMALDVLGPEFIGIGLKDSIDALEKLTGDTSLIPDIIFLDVNMPKMNGIELLQEINQLVNLKNTPVLMYTTSWDHNVMSICKQFGANEYLVKPYTLDSLVECLREVLISKIKLE